MCPQKKSPVLFVPPPSHPPRREIQDAALSVWIVTVQRERGSHSLVTPKQRGTPSFIHSKSPTFPWERGLETRKPTEAVYDSHEGVLTNPGEGSAAVPAESLLWNGGPSHLMSLCDSPMLWQLRAGPAPCWPRSISPALLPVGDAWTSRALPPAGSSNPC